MKTFIWVLFLTCVLSAQTILDQPLEISTRTKGFDSEDEIRFSIIPVGTAWCNDFGDFYIDQASASDEYVYGDNYDDESWDYGFNVCFHNQGWEYFWLCFNEMTIYVNDTERAHFYLDYRDCNYGVSCSGIYDLAILIEKVVNQQRYIL